MRTIIYIVLYILYFLLISELSSIIKTIIRIAGRKKRVKFICPFCDRIHDSIELMEKCNCYHFSIESIKGDYPNPKDSCPKSIIVTFVSLRDRRNKKTLIFTIDENEEIK